MDNDKLVGVVIVLGLAIVGSYIKMKNYVDNQNDYVNFGLQSDVNGPSTMVPAGFLNPIATHAAPRMYVMGGTGSSPNRNPGESWLQGGGASITNTTGRWAA